MNQMQGAFIETGAPSAPEFFIPANAVVCTVHFGVPDKQGNCLQVGICRVIVDAAPTEKENRRCRLAQAYAFPGADGGLDMYFPAEDILPCTERAVFRNKWLPVPVRCEMPEELILRFDEAVMPVVAPGRYPITRYQDGYLISF